MVFLPSLRLDGSDLKQRGGRRAEEEEEGGQTEGDRHTLAICSPGTRLACGVMSGASSLRLSHRRRRHVEQEVPTLRVTERECV